MALIIINLPFLPIQSIDIKNSFKGFLAMSSQKLQKEI
jgi:hypothetical protein